MPIPSYRSLGWCHGIVFVLCLIGLDLMHIFSQKANMGVPSCNVADMK